MKNDDTVNVPREAIEDWRNDLSLHGVGDIAAAVEMDNLLAAAPKAEPVSDYRLEAVKHLITTRLTLHDADVTLGGVDRVAADIVAMLVPHPEAPKAEPKVIGMIGHVSHGRSELAGIVAALASSQPEAPKVEQEPVAWRWQTPIPHVGDGTRWGWTFASHDSTPPASINAEPLYTHPAPASDELLEAKATVLDSLLSSEIDGRTAKARLIEYRTGVLAVTKHKGTQS